MEGNCNCRSLLGNSVEFVVFVLDSFRYFAKVMSNVVTFIVICMKDKTVSRYAVLS